MTGDDTSRYLKYLTELIGREWKARACNSDSATTILPPFLEYLDGNSFPQSPCMTFLIIRFEIHKCRLLPFNLLIRLSHLGSRRSIRASLAQAFSDMSSSSSSSTILFISLSFALFSLHSRGCYLKFEIVSRNYYAARIEKRRNSRAKCFPVFMRHMLRYEWKRNA